eukprot:SAG25_NODE_191_length_12265_cov_16.310538_7_plen_98_part_00
MILTIAPLNSQSPRSTDNLSTDRILNRSERQPLRILRMAVQRGHPTCEALRLELPPCRRADGRCAPYDIRRHMACNWRAVHASPRARRPITREEAGV